jgi:murein DD-endopeptidase
MSPNGSNVNIKSSTHHALSLLLLMVLGLLGGCSTSPRYRYASPAADTRPAIFHSEVVALARELLGTPYRYGGHSPRQGFDCSGLVYYVHQEAGLRLPRTSYGQFKATRPVGLHHLRPGDLVFFRLKRYKISHVGIYIGHDQFIHAPSSGKDVTIDELSEPYWHRHFVRGGRTL